MTRASLGDAGNELIRRQQASDDVVCLMVVEDQAGASHLEEILSVEGVTGAAIGPGDLSMELGVDSWDHPSVTQLLDAMAATVRRHTGSALLRLGRTPEEASRMVASGANLVLMNHDVLLIQAMYAGLFAQCRRSIAGS
jgi:2-dehydro-3-deoxyglucarate aldolase